MFKSIGIVIRTLQHLTLKQVIYQITYRLNILRFFTKGIVIKVNPIEINSFDFSGSHHLVTVKPYTFNFLNKTVIFKERINWNFKENGKLWNYNLHYFEFITQEDFNQEECIRIFKSYYSNYSKIFDGKEPYPTSLRIMNLVKIKAKYHDSKELEFILKNDIERLFQSLEFHLLGNHLLENAFALFFGAHLFPSEKRLVNRALKLLSDQLNEQILQDGGHFERSYMYHQIILGRILDSISLCESNPQPWNLQIKKDLKLKAQKMIEWTNSISNNGINFIRFNDSVEGIAPKRNELIRLAIKLNLDIQSEAKLNDSGFRKFELKNFTFLINAGEVKPKYQPAHAHANTFSFTLTDTNKPIIVEPGISTYENNPIRWLQRSSSNHNTVTINNINNNETWSSFRVGRRADVHFIKDTPEQLIVSHNGFRHLGLEHRREVICGNEGFQIYDEVIGDLMAPAESHLHFYPGINIEFRDNSNVIIDETIKLSFIHHEKLRLMSYDYCVGFNNTVKAQKLLVTFNKKLKSHLEI